MKKNIFTFVFLLLSSHFAVGGYSKEETPNSEFVFETGIDSFGRVLHVEFLNKNEERFGNVAFPFLDDRIDEMEEMSSVSLARIKLPSFDKNSKFSNFKNPEFTISSADIQYVQLDIMEFRYIRFGFVPVEGSSFEFYDTEIPTKDDPLNTRIPFEVRLDRYGKKKIVRITPSSKIKTYEQGFPSFWPYFRNKRTTVVPAKSLKSGTSAAMKDFSFCGCQPFPMHSLNLKRLKGDGYDSHVRSITGWELQECDMVLVLAGVTKTLTFERIPHGWKLLPRLQDEYSDYCPARDSVSAPIDGAASISSSLPQQLVNNEESGMQLKMVLSFENASNINDMGTNSLGEKKAFIWNKKTGIKYIGSLGGKTTIPKAINNRGEVVGDSETNNGVQHPFLWTPKSGMIDLLINSDAEGGASDINNHGQIGGYIKKSGKKEGAIWSGKSEF